MKSITFLALLGFAGAIQLKYDESEGPTMKDSGENDDQVLHASSLDHNKGVKWTNPTLWHDDGSDDDKVLTQQDGTLIVLKSTRGGESMPDLRRHIEHLEDLDNFYHPAVHGIVEDIFNTHHLELPFHPPPNFDDQEPDAYAQRYYFGQSAGHTDEERIHF